MFRILAMLASVVTAGSVSAASFVDIDVKLRIDSINWGDVEVRTFVQDPLGPGPSSGDYEITEAYRLYEKGQSPVPDSYLYHPLSHLNVGDIVTLTARIIPTDNSTHFGYAPDCTIASYDCAVREGSYTWARPGPESISIGSDITELWSVSGDLSAGSAVTFFWVPDRKGGEIYSDDEMTVVSWFNSNVDFTVAEDTHIVSTPVPASLPMLAAGLFGMGYLGRRQRRRDLPAKA